MKKSTLIVIILIAVFVLFSLLVLAGVLGLLFFISNQLADSTPANLAMQEINQNEEITNVFGEPIEKGILVSGTLEHNKFAEIKLPIKGPKAKGTLLLEANFSRDQWQLIFLKVKSESFEKVLINK